MNRKLFQNESGQTALETAIILLAFVVVAVVFAWSILTTPERAADPTPTPTAPMATPIIDPWDLPDLPGEPWWYLQAETDFVSVSRWIRMTAPTCPDWEWRAIFLSADPMTDPVACGLEIQAHVINGNLLEVWVDESHTIRSEIPTD